MKDIVGDFMCFFFVNVKAANIGSHEKPVLSVATLGSYVFSSSEDCTIRTWDRRMPGNFCDKKRVSQFGNCVCVCKLFVKTEMKCLCEEASLLGTLPDKTAFQ